MGISERKAREKEQRQNAIIDAAERVFFSKGRHLATMDDVALEAELSKGTIYLYFKNKEELYLAIHLRGLKILQEIFLAAVHNQPTGLDQAIAVGEAYYRFAQEHADYFSALIYYESHDIEIENENTFANECATEGGETLGVLIDAIRQGIADGSIRSDLDPIKTAVILWGQTSGLIQLTSLKSGMLQKFYDLESRELINYMMRLLTEQLRKK